MPAGLPAAAPLGVAVDGRALCGPRSGIGVFTAAVVERWLADGRPVRVLVRRGSDPGLPAGAPVVEVGPPFHVRAAGIAHREGLRYFSPDSLIVPALLGRPATATVHDLAPIDRPDTQTRRVRLAYRLLLGAAARRAGAVVVPSEATRAALARHHPEARVHTVPEAARQLPEPGPLPAGVRPPYVLFTGTLEPRKHPLELAEAFLAAVPPPWQLVLVGGRGWLAEAALHRLERLAAGGRVRLLGRVADPVLAGLLAAADAVAYPSAYEGFGLPVLEAMAAGVPVLTTNAAALAELAEDAALLVDLAGPDPYGAGLREALARLTGDASLRAQLAAAGRERAAGYSWAASAERLWHVVTAPR